MRKPTVSPFRLLPSPVRRPRRRLDALCARLARKGHSESLLPGLLAALPAEVSWTGKGLSRLPATGALIVIANHPLGWWDEILLLGLMARYRPDFRLLADPARRPAALRDSYLTEATASAHLAQGGAVGVFPVAGGPALPAQERPWRQDLIAWIQAARQPVVPVFIQGRGERVGRRPSQVQVQVGLPISPAEWENLPDTARLSRYLRTRTYALGSGLPVPAFFRPRLARTPQPEPLAPAGDAARLAAEVAALPPAQCLCRQDRFAVYVAQAEQIPALLAEIGRCRELTFRTVGEGTGYPCDTDEYDLYYRHLFLWDEQAGTIAGAYRLGPGDEIMRRYGKQGFYLHSLFKMKAAFAPWLQQALELGRSFVLPDYQRQRLPLFLLWKGIYTYLAAHPQYRYLIGPVSISNDYTPLSRSFIVAFIRRYYFDEALARHVRPRKPFRPARGQVDPEALAEGITGGDLRQADRVIDALEPAHARLPILLKKYIKQNARIIGFNVDPKFNQALDGLIIMDMRDIPEETVTGMER